jgi:ATP-binding cassette subfamily C protein
MSLTGSTADSPVLLAVRFVSALIRTLGWRLALAVALSFAVAFAEGAGLLLLVPLLASIGLAPGDPSSSRIAELTSRALGTMRLTPSLGGVLLVFVVISLVHSLTTRAASLLAPTLVNRFVVTLRRRLYAAIVSARWSFIAERRASDLAHAVTVDADRCGTAASQFLGLVGSAAVSAAYLAIAARLSPGMTAIVAVAGALLLFLLGGRTRASERRATAFTDASRALFAMTTQSLNGLKVAKTVGAEARDVALFTELDHSVATAYESLLESFANTRVRLDLVTVLGVSALLATAVWLFQLRGTGLLLLVFVCARVIPRVRALQESAQMMLAGLPAFRAVETTIADCERHAEPQDEDATRLRLTRDLQLEAVSFRYASAHRDALDGVSLTIPVGRTTAVVGVSGSGKSTLADLVMGLMAPAAGRIAIDGQTLDAPTMRRWRRSVGYVPQDSFLLHDTIRANLHWAVPAATDAQLWEALDRAAARGFVEAHPQGLEAVVGDRGLRLSGGERQRLALARALLAAPDVLLLDEATSALDSINEQQILASLRRLHGRLTIVVITHRLSTIRDADVIHVLDGGRVVESGSWNELAGGGAMFTSLLEAQRLAESPIMQ